MQVESIQIRDVLIGDGMPKICVPIVGRHKEDILRQAEQIVPCHPDCVELRIDWFERVDDVEQVLVLLQELRSCIGNIVLLFTFRTKQEGGEREIDAHGYRSLCERVCESGLIDLLDVETFFEEGLLQTLCDVAHKNRVHVVASNHDFSFTPSEKEIWKRLKYMDDMGADIPKIAVMPNKERDVLSLLSGTLRYYEEGGRKPVITMSMKDMGVISRLCGETFGSALTFAAVGQTSAPGQMNIEQVRTCLEILHR